MRGCGGIGGGEEGGAAGITVAAAVAAILERQQDTTSTSTPVRRQQRSKQEEQGLVAALQRRFDPGAQLEARKTSSKRPTKENAEEPPPKNGDIDGASTAELNGEVRSCQQAGPEERVQEICKSQSKKNLSSLIDEVCKSNEVYSANSKVNGITVSSRNVKKDNSDSVSGKSDQKPLIGAKLAPSVTPTNQQRIPRDIPGDLQANRDHPTRFDQEESSGSSDEDSGSCSSCGSTERLHVISDIEEESSAALGTLTEEEEEDGELEQGGDDSSGEEDEEDSTLKCSGTGWSGSDSVAQRRSSSTSDFSSSSSEEDSLDQPTRSSIHRASEDLSTAGCEEDFQWVCSSKQGMEHKQRQPNTEKEELSNSPSPQFPVHGTTSESRIITADSGIHNHNTQKQKSNYSSPRIIEPDMSPGCEKSERNRDMYTPDTEMYDYHPRNSEVSHRKPPRPDSSLKPASSFDKASSLDRRRQSGTNRASRDQKSLSSIVLHSPRFRSPSRLSSPSASDCMRHNGMTCCSESPKHHCSHGLMCCDSASSLHREHSHECIHHIMHSSSFCNEPTHCCSSPSVRDDLMTSSLDSSYSETLGHHHHHHHHGLRSYGSAGKLDCHRRMHHNMGSQQELRVTSDCCNGGGDGFCYHGSSPFVPPCHCQESLWRHLYKPPSNSDVEERLRRLEADKDSLQLQVTVLTEQIEVQTDKIADLEKLLEEKKKQLAHTEDLLQREMLSRSSLETQKLELLSAMSELKLQQAALERDNLELRERLGEERRRNKPPMMPRTTLMSTSTPLGPQSTAPLLGGLSPSPSPVSSLSEGSPRRLGNHPNSVEDFKDIPAPRVILEDTPPANYRRKVEHYGSLPRQRVTTNGTAVSPLDSNSVNNSPSIAVPNTKKGVAFGKGLSSFLPFQHPQHQVSKCRVAGPDKSYSSPNLAETERIVIEDNMVESSTVPAAPDEVDGSTGSYSLSPQPSPSLHVNKSKGIKKIFGRMKRSGSGNLDDLPGEGEFRRGGVRATAGPRLGWTNQPVIKTKPDAPFNEWDSEAICRWLQELGLECYAADAKQWVKTGAQLLQATSHEIEKELGIKNPVHRKKLQLALLSQQESVTSLDPHIIPAGELDTAWVLRWLDDVGLPQHKETFLAARVDGRVLHRLTMDDLATTLHVSSLLHVASLRRGIQVLREHSFEPNCLKRRSLPDDPVQPTASDVALWTNHRVMEWLRVVDLAEYAPNLRGSGVHGGLMVHEPRFTAELLASLLSIPPSKTLLRRHLNTHFKELLGRECIQEKREAEATLGYVPLTATTKVKIAKKSQFTLKRKKSKSELDFGDLVCPLDPSKSGETSQPPGDGMTRTTSAQAQKALGAFHEAESSSSADALSCDSPLSERTSNV